MVTDQSKKKKETTAAKDDEAEFLDYCSFSREQMLQLANGTAADREKATVPVSTVRAADALKQQNMSFVGHMGLRPLSGHWSTQWSIFGSTHYVPPRQVCFEGCNVGFQGSGCSSATVGNHSPALHSVEIA